LICCKGLGLEASLELFEVASPCFGEELDPEGDDKKSDRCEHEEGPESHYCVQAAATRGRPKREDFDAVLEHLCHAALDTVAARGRRGETGISVVQWAAL
jgi:hypothetical protein